MFTIFYSCFIVHARAVAGPDAGGRGFPGVELWREEEVHLAKQQSVQTRKTIYNPFVFQCPLRE